MRNLTNELPRLATVVGREFMLKCFKLLGSLKPRLRVRRRSLAPDSNDVLSHPEISRMSLHQLADLPFDR
jgi:hypothetical protein